MSDVKLFDAMYALYQILLDIGSLVQSHSIKIPVDCHTCILLYCSFAQKNVRIF